MAMISLLVEVDADRALDLLAEVAFARTFAHGDDDGLQRVVGLAAKERGQRFEVRPLDDEDAEVLGLGEHLLKLLGELARVRLVRAVDARQVEPEHEVGRTHDADFLAHSTSSSWMVSFGRPVCLPYAMARRLSASIFFLRMKSTTGRTLSGARCEKLAASRASSRSSERATALTERADRLARVASATSLASDRPLISCTTSSSAPRT